MESDIGLASCDGDSSCPSDQVIEQRGHKNFVKPGGDNLKLFGSSRPYEILSKIKRYLNTDRGASITAACVTSVELAPRPAVDKQCVLTVLELMQEAKLGM